MAKMDQIHKIEYRNLNLDELTKVDIKAVNNNTRAVLYKGTSVAKFTSRLLDNTSTQETDFWTLVIYIRKGRKWVIDKSFYSKIDDCVESDKIFDHKHEVYLSEKIALHKFNNVGKIVKRFERIDYDPMLVDENMSKKERRRINRKRFLRDLKAKFKK